MTDARPISCTARVVLTDDQVRWLDTRPGAGHQVDASPYCALEAGHPGQHAAFGQQGMGQHGGAVSWWLRWTHDVLFEPAEIVGTRNCPVESETVINKFGEHDPCLLYQEHPGRHSFELDLADEATAGEDDPTREPGGHSVISHRSCMARIDLDDDERAWLNSMPTGTDEIGACLHCGLHAGHPGPHVALGQAAGDDEYWVRWTLRASEIVKLSPCPEHGGPAPDVGCLLFEHHPGRCTFERED